MSVFENRDEIQQEQVSPIQLLEELAKKRSRSKEPTECNFYKSADDVPDPNDISPEHKNLMIYDDLLFRSRTSVRHITFVEDIQIAIVCIYHKLISNFHAKQFVKMQTSFVCFPRT